MQVTLTCPKCLNKYQCDKINTTIYGPVVTSTCFVCHTDTVRNISAFVGKQTERTTGRLPRAAAMMRLSRNMCKIINDEKLFEDRKAEYWRKRDGKAGKRS